MSQRWTGPLGLDIELIILDDRPCYRVRRRRILDGYCYTLADLKALLAREGLEMADLEEVEETDPECELSGLS